MKIRTQERDGIQIAVVTSDEVIIQDVQSTLDFLVTLRYETGCDRAALNKAAVTEDFFILSTRLAGEVLQKFVNYNMKLAIYGDFSCYTSKALKDFIYESNKGNSIFFTESEEEAVMKLSQAK